MVWVLLLVPFCVCFLILLCFVSESVWCFFVLGLCLCVCSWFVLWFVMLVVVWFMMCNVGVSVFAFLCVSVCVCFLMFKGVFLCSCSRVCQCVCVCVFTGACVCVRVQACACVSCKVCVRIKGVFEQRDDRTTRRETGTEIANDKEREDQLPDFTFLNLFYRLLGPT